MKYENTSVFLWNEMLIFEFRFDEANFFISHFLMSRWSHKRQACYGIIAITIQYVYYQTNGSVLYVLLHSIVAVAQSAMHNGIISLLREHLKISMFSEFEWLVKSWFNKKKHVPFGSGKIWILVPDWSTQSKRVSDHVIGPLDFNYFVWFHENENGLALVS